MYSREAARTEEDEEGEGTTLYPCILSPLILLLKSSLYAVFFRDLKSSFPQVFFLEPEAQCSFLTVVV